jgi:hypothetical protein
VGRRGVTHPAEPVGGDGGDVVLSDAARTLARTLIAQGRPTGDGLVEVPLSVRQIAELSHRSPGTVQALLRQLDQHRVRVDARRRLYDPRQLDPAAASGTAPAADAHQRSVAALAALVALVSNSPDQLDAAAAIAAEVLGQVADQSREAHRATPTPAARPARDRRAALRDTDRAAFVEQSSPSETGSEKTGSEKTGSEKTGSEGEGDDHSSSSLSVGSRAVAPVARTGSAGRAPSRSVADTAALVDPLVRACARLGLPGVTNSTLLRQRLDPYSDAQVRYAVSRLLLEANAGGLRSPVGKLAALAARADPDYFVADPPAVTLPGEQGRASSATPLPPDPADPAVVSHSLHAARSLLRR